MAESGALPDRAFSHKFKVTVLPSGGGVEPIVIGCTEVEGLSSAAEVYSYREGDEGPRLRKYTGLVTHGNVIIRQGITSGRFALEDWHANVVDDGDDARRTVTINVYGRGSNILRTWTLEGALAVELSTGTLSSGGGSILPVSLTIAYDELITD